MEIKGEGISYEVEKWLYGYDDADWIGNRSDRKTNSGYLFKFLDLMFDWRCKEQTCIALSTEAKYLNRLLLDFQTGNIEIIIIVDIQSCLIVEK